MPREEAVLFEPEIAIVRALEAPVLAKVAAGVSPEQALLEFLQSTYEAAANCANWDRAALECAWGQPGVVRQV